jgi:hypothetical protein
MASYLLQQLRNGATYTWNPATAGALETRAAVVSGAPTTSLMSLVSDRDRHLFLMGTEETIGTPSTQNKMFIRFSNQEDINTWNLLQPILQVHFSWTKEMKSLEQCKVKIIF